jgi:hypothetical protein
MREVNDYFVAIPFCVVERLKREATLTDPNEGKHQGTVHTVLCN